MAGETIKSEAICLDIRPWSRTSHIVTWLTPTGRVATVVKGAVRPKSQFLGQYDLNYVCEIVYYARAKGDLHALRECLPVELQEPLRGDFRKAVLAGYFRKLVGDLAPDGDECREWYGLLKDGLRTLMPDLSTLVGFEMKALGLSGVRPDFSGFDRNAEWSGFSLETGTFGMTDGRSLRISRDVAEYLCRGARNPKNSRIPLDAARVLGVFYQFHLEFSPDIRRTVLEMVCNN